ncbi:MAG: hypothetical protein PVJ76_13965, partial [Gemmatimonadota bacterium]
MTGPSDFGPKDPDPPRWAQKLLRWALGAAGARSILADLAEEYDSMARRRPMAARWWHRWETWKLALHFLFARLRARGTGGVNTGKGRRNVGRPGGAGLGEKIFRNVR